MSKGKAYYIKTLDGWRGIAVIAVILSHLKDSVLSPSSSLFPVFASGLNGVDLFFAISGFLIASNIFKELDRTDTIDFKKFYLKRFFRLMPAAWLYLLIIFLMSPVLIKVYDIEIISTLTFWRNYLILEDPNASYTGQFWSLMIEEHFYLFLPLLLFTVRKPQKLLMAVILIGIAVAVWRKLGTMSGVVAIFPPIRFTMWYTFGRFDTLLYGVLLAILQRHYPQVTDKLKRISPYLPLMALIILFVLRVPFRPVLEALLYPLIFFSTINHEESYLSQILENRVLRYVGTISYSLYIWQQLFVHRFTGGPDWFKALGGEWHSVLIIFAVAALSYHLIEDPFRRLGTKIMNNSKGSS